MLLQHWRQAAVQPHPRGLVPRIVRKTTRSIHFVMASQLRLETAKAFNLQSLNYPNCLSSGRGRRKAWPAGSQRQRRSELVSFVDWPPRSCYEGRECRRGDIGSRVSSAAPSCFGLYGQLSLPRPETEWLFHSHGDERPGPLYNQNSQSRQWEGVLSSEATSLAMKRSAHCRKRIRRWETRNSRMR